MASLAGGALLFEVTFSWPGIALRLHEAISQRLYLGPRYSDFYLYANSLSKSSCGYINAFLDPRIEY